MSVLDTSPSTPLVVRALLDAVRVYRSATSRGARDNVDNWGAGGAY